MSLPALLKRHSTGYPKSTEQYFNKPTSTYDNIKFTTSIALTIASLYRVKNQKLTKLNRSMSAIFACVMLSLASSKLVCRVTKSWAFNCKDLNSLSAKTFFFFSNIYERISIGPNKAGTFTYSELLPALPLPPLKESADRFLEFLKVIEPERIEELKKQWETFIKTEAPALHRKLQALWYTQVSYVEEIWIHLAYLQTRTALPLCHSWWGTDIDNPALLTEDEALDRTARLMYAAVEMRGKLREETYSPVVMNKIPADMEPYKLLFGTNRIPEKGCDTMSAYPDSRHVIVVYKGNLVQFNLVDESGQLLSCKEIKKQLEKIKTAYHSKTEVDIAALTGQDRDLWASHRALVIEKSPEDLKAVEEALFLVHLSNQEPMSIEEQSKASFIKQGSLWYDKFIQFVCYKNGVVNGYVEHTPADATIPADMWRWLLKREQELAQEQASESLEVETMHSPTSHHVLTPLPFYDCQILKPLCSKARETLGKSLASKKIQVLDFNDFGAKAIKGKRKISPDAFIQIAMQKAIYEARDKVLTNTYAVASTRAFAHGRTETIRPLTAEVKEYLELAPGALDHEKKQALETALTKHFNNRLLASTGKGVDRHLGSLCAVHLSSLPKEEQKAENLPEALQSFSRASKFFLATSQTPCPTFTGGGFLPVIPEGLGVSYVVRDNRLIFHIVNDTKESDDLGDRFLENLHSALHEQMRLLEVR